MNTVSSSYPKKLRAMRIAEGLTQQKLADMSGVGLSSIKNYESGQKEAGLSIIERMLSLAEFKKYTLWLMTDETNEAAGQIAPPLSPDGQGSISNHQNGKKAG